jgi:hypothetical protein
VKKQQPSLWTLGLGALDLGREHAGDVKRSFRDYHPVPFRVVAGGALLTLGLVLVAMDLARWQSLRALWYGELARRGEGLQHRPEPRRLRQIQQAAAPKQAQMRSREAGHDLAH